MFLSEIDVFFGMSSLNCPLHYTLRNTKPSSADQIEACNPKGTTGMMEFHSFLL